MKRMRRPMGRGHADSVVVGHPAQIVHRPMRTLGGLCCWLQMLAIVLLVGGPPGPGRHLNRMQSAAAAELPIGASDGKVCRGTHYGISHSHNDKPWDRYLMYRKMYTNCTYIDGNLEIVFLDGDDDYDMSFLKDVQEVTGYVLIVSNYAEYIPLTSLRIIRGRMLYTEKQDGRGYSLYVALNYKPKSQTTGLKELQLVSLHEITDGNVMFYNNNLLCFENTINWKDIQAGDNAEVFHHRNSKDLPRDCTQCHDNCTNGYDKNCWGEGPDMCQTLTRVVCSPQCDGRCYGPQPNQCCHSECAGGCEGPTKKECWACKNFVDDRQCVAFCPAEYRYDPTTYRKAPNPNAKYAYGSICVKRCPGHLMADRGACVSDCGAGRIASASDGRCVECDGPCPKTCPGVAANDFVSAANIRNFTGCTVIQGAIRILPSTFHGDPARNITGILPSDLRAFESVREITDFVQIQANDPRFRNLHFFRNLRVIHGRNLDNIGASFHIYHTSLESLNMNQLNTISNGGIFIKSNSRLCYVDKINWTMIRRNPDEKRAVMSNANATLCETQRKVCHTECTEAGCWGPGDDQCLACAHYRHGQRCLASCEQETGLYLNGSAEVRAGMCGRCHAECNGSCRGPGPDQCDTCLHVRDGPYCVAECPSSKYAETNGTCSPCHEHCDEGAGCTGPLDEVGPGACNSCAVVRFDDAERSGGAPVARCLPADVDCGDGFYRGQVPFDMRTPGVGKQGCMRCHRECRTCSGPSLAFCSQCHHLKEDGKCVTNCSNDHYYDSTSGGGICRKCDSRCNGCTGPSEADCIACKLFKIVRRHDVDYNRVQMDSGDTMYMEQFNCTDKCPEDIPHKVTETVNGLAETICTVEPIVFDKRQQVGIIIGVVIGCVVLIGFIAVPIVYLRRQWARAEENKLRLTARMSGLDESEPLTPSDAKPDMAMLRLIKESELRRGNIIGSGAFGTVYKGVWVPEGENVKIPVAIKALQEGTAPAQNKELLEEARVMASVVHPCCVRILAICMTAQVMLVTPLVPLGALLDYVRRHRTNISSKNFLNWSTQIAKGMSYLEQRGIVHRDLAARNVLVQSPNQVKITDFGLAKLLDYNEYGYHAVGGKMPIKWLALECIEHRIFTHKSDVWSFGVTMWELFTYGQKPYESIRAKDISDLLEKGERLPQPSICTIDVYMIMIKCWMLDADSRPSFRELSDEFAKMARDPGRYLVIPGDKLMRLPSHTYDTLDLVRNMSIPADGPEEVITAEEYLQPQTAAARHRRALATGGNGSGTIPYHINGALELAQDHCMMDDDQHRSSGGRRARPRPDPRLGNAGRDSPYFFPPPHRHWRGNRSSDSQNTDRAVSPSLNQECDTATTTTSGYASPSKELQTSLHLPVDEDDYLQPQMTKSSPIYLDLIDSPKHGRDERNAEDSNQREGDSDVGFQSPSPPPPSMIIDTHRSQPTSPVAVNNPEYFEDLLPDSEPVITGGCGGGIVSLMMTGSQEARPVRLRSESTESTASDHDEYDRLNGSSSSSNGVGGKGEDVGCNVPLSSIRLGGSVIGGKGKSNGLGAVVIANGVPHRIFTESVL